MLLEAQRHTNVLLGTHAFQLMITLIIIIIIIIALICDCCVTDMRSRVNRKRTGTAESTYWRSIKRSTIFCR